LGPAAAGSGHTVDADGRRVDAGKVRRARTDGGRDEPGFQCRLYLLGRKTGDLQGPFEVSLDGGTYKLKRRMKIVLCFRKLPTFLWRNFVLLLFRKDHPMGLIYQQ